MPYLKALLFICAGVVIHSIKDSQDIGLIGNISFEIPLTSTCLIISNFAIRCIAFLVRFYSETINLQLKILQPLTN